MERNVASSEGRHFSSDNNINRKSAPFTLYPPLYATPIQQRPLSPSSFSPSPYVFNRKGRSLHAVTQMHHDYGDDYNTVSNSEFFHEVIDRKPNQESPREENREIIQAMAPNRAIDKENFQTGDVYDEISDECLSKHVMMETRATDKENQVSNGDGKIADESLSVELEIRQAMMASTRKKEKQFFNSYGESLTRNDHGHQREASSSSSLDQSDFKEKFVRKHDIFNGDGGTSDESLSPVDDWIHRVSSFSSSSLSSSSSSLAPSETKEEDQNSNSCDGISDESLNRKDDHLHRISGLSSPDQSGMKEDMEDESCLISDKLENGKIHTSCQTVEEFYDASEEGILDGYTSEGIDSKCRTLEVVEPNTESRFSCEVVKRIQAEESLAELQLKWNEMARIFSSIGQCVADFHNNKESRQNINPLEQLLSEKLTVARVVAASVARATICVEKDEEFQSILEAKNREILRLHGKMQYYELVNREMSQRNREIIEATQRRKRRHQNRRKIITGCIGASLFVGTTGLILYKLFPWKQAILITPSNLGHESGEKGEI